MHKQALIYYKEENITALFYNNCNYDGSSHINVEGENPVTVLSMSANCSNGYITINKTISNPELYKENREIADTDYEEFENKVYAAFGLNETTTK